MRQSDCRTSLIGCSSPNKATINGGNKTDTDFGAEFVTESKTEIVTCDCCGAIDPGRLERSLLGLPQKHAMAAPLVRRIQEALFGRRAYLLSKRREQAFCREALVKASASLPPTEKRLNTGKKRVSLALSSDTNSVPFSDFLGHNPSALSPIPLSSQNGTHKGGQSYSESLSQCRKHVFSHSKRNLHQEMEEEQEDERRLKRRRFSLDSKLSTPFESSDPLETEEGRSSFALEDHRSGNSLATDPACQMPTPGQSPNNLTAESVPQKNTVVQSKKEAFELKEETKKGQINAALLSGKEAFDAKVVRCSNAILSLQCYTTMVEDLKRPVLDLPIFCEYCPNNIAFEIQKAFMNCNEVSGSEEHFKPEKEGKVVMQSYPIGLGQVAVLQASYFWLETSHQGVNGIRDLLKQVTEFVGVRERLMEMERDLKWAKEVAVIAEADCDALKGRRLMREKEREREKGSHEERNKQQSSTSSLVEGVLTGLMNERVAVLVEAVRPHRAPYHNLLEDINVELKRILARTREIHMSEKRKCSLEGIDGFGLSFLRRSEGEELEVLKTCFSLWLLFYHSVGHAIGARK